MALWLLVTCGALARIAAAPADEVLRQTSVFIEGEDFAPRGEGWAAGGGWADDIYEATSGDAVIGNGGGGGEAVAEVTIPADGTYRVWVRYLKIGTYPGTFGLRIEQAGGPVFEGEYRTQPEGDDWRPVWEQHEATLTAGPATVTLAIAKPGIRQRIDCVLLTPDPAYQPDYHDFAKQVFLRFRVAEPAEDVTARITTYMHRAPRWYGDLGSIAAPAGQWSPWFDASKEMDGGKRLTTVKLRFVSRDQPLAHLKAELQVAPQADEAEAQTFHEDLEGDILSLSLPGDVARYPELCLLTSELTRRHLESVRTLGLPPLPDNEAGIPLEVGIWGWGDSYRSPRVLGQHMEAARLLGANTLNDLIGGRRELAEGLGFRRMFLSQWLPHQAWGCPSDPGLARMMDEHFAQAAERIRTEDPEALAQCGRNILWDEPGTSDLKHLAQCAACIEAFHAYLKEQGFAPGDFGQAAWDGVKPLPREQATDPATRRLHYRSIEFRDLTNARLVREAHLASEKHLGAHILTSVNFTDGAISGWDGALSHGPDWFLYGRLKAESLLWSEDWASLGPEVSGLIADTLRAAARPSGLPIGEYIICNHVPTLEQRAFSALMHGARTLHFYCYGPYFAFADGMVSDNPDVQRALGLTLRNIARADPYLRQAEVPPAEVAILWGKSHELWQQDAAVGTERRTMYLAMQHAHVPVDIVCEEDLAEGRLAGYKLLILTESNVRREAAARVAAWVRAGGTLQMCAGAGLRDEYDEPLSELLDVAGVQVDSVEKPGGDYREHYGIPHTASRGDVSLAAGDLWEACALPILGYREAARPTTAEAPATFDDGAPAVFRARAGEGHVLRFAFMPGLGYVKSAAPGPDRVTVGYKPEQLSVLAAGLRLAGVEAPFVLSSPLVEAQLLHGPKADVLVLANWSGGDMASLMATLRDGRRYSAAESLTAGPLALQRQGRAVSVTLALGNTDVIVLSK